MLRPVSLLPALVAVVSLAACLLAPAAVVEASPAAAPALLRAPLVVTIDNLSSSTIPERGPIRVSGRVTNFDDETWSSLALYAFVSTTPMTSQAELADAAAAPATVEVGSRIIAPGTYAEIDALEPGETAQYSFSVPRSQIDVTEAGVYWFGVHALGESPEGRIDGADGRARTFLPYVPRTQKAVDTALVVPIRRQIVHAPDGSIADVSAWTESLEPGGALRSLVDLGAAAGSRPITWLVDPAVVDAVRRLAAGNPPRSLASTVTDGDGEDGQSASPDPSASPSDDPTDPADPADPADTTDATEPTPTEVAAAEAAAAWLERLRVALEDGQILTLPYGDVDVAAAAKHDPDLYRQARKRSSGVLQPWGLPTSPAVASPTGYIDAAGIRLTEPAATLLMTDRMLGTNAPSVARIDGRRVAVTSSGAADGGPGPNQRMAPLAVRQRIVSEAALRLLTRGPKPLVVAFPATWNPQPAAGFFEGLDLDWLDLTSLSAAMQRTGTEVRVDRLDYPETQERLELDATSFSEARDLIQAGDTLQNLLTRNDQVGSEVRDEAVADVSYSSRLRAEAARGSADRSRAWIESQLRSVRIDAPRAVILSGGSGRFAATITNTLEHPVTVRIDAVPDPPLDISVPADSIDLGPQSRTTILLNASSPGLGIRSVTLLLTDVDNVPLGSSDDVPIRSNRVSNVIWLIMGTGVALLFGAIVVRLFRRIRTAARS